MRKARAALILATLAMGACTTTDPDQELDLAACEGNRACIREVNDYYEAKEARRVARLQAGLMGLSRTVNPPRPAAPAQYAPRPQVTCYRNFANHVVCN